MDAFTMVILACVAGEPKCTSARVADVGFTSIEACEARIDGITDTMTREFGRKPEFKGRAVTYDVSCMSRKELRETLGIADLDA